MKKLTIYHNPRCSKSRDALAILQERKCSITIIEYLKTPLSASQIKMLLRQLKIKPIDLIRIKEPIFRNLNYLDHQQTLN